MWPECQAAADDATALRLFGAAVHAGSRWSLGCGDTFLGHDHVCGRGGSHLAGRRADACSIHALAGETGRQPLFIWGGGVALPALTLTALVPYVMTFGHETRASTGSDSLAVDITGNLYWWEISYRLDGAAVPVLSANELRIPIGEPVEVVLATRDVIHSFWIPSLAGKLDMVPGRVTRMTFQADRPGVFRGQCAEFCGTQHALMAFDVVAMPRAAFDAWLARLSQPVPKPETSELREGMELFLGLGCGGCHTVRGLSESPLGPDLTQIGARRSVGAGALPGGLDGITRWLSASEHIKPGNAMPSYEHLEEEQIRSIAGYLESLK